LGFDPDILVRSGEAHADIVSPRRPPAADELEDDFIGGESDGPEWEAGEISGRPGNLPPVLNEMNGE
jgi:hypothetical protein